MITFTTIVSAMRNQLPFLPEAFTVDSASDAQAPELNGTTEEREAIDAFRKVWVLKKEKLDEKFIPFHLEFTSIPFVISMNESIADQFKQIYRAIRGLAEYEVGMAVKKQKIKSVIGADRSILFGKWDFRNEGNKIWYSCKVNLWATSK